MSAPNFLMAAWKEYRAGRDLDTAQALAFTSGFAAGMECAVAKLKGEIIPPSTVAQQVASAQAEVATWPDGKLAGGDQP